MLELLISVILSVAPISLHQKPYAYHINIAHAQTASLSSSLLAVSEIPHPPENLPLDENIGENTAYHDFDPQTSPEAIVERKTLGVEEIKGLIKQYFPDEPLMLKIVACESSLIHYENGKVLKGRTTPDYGVFQINEIWIPTAKKLNLDIMTLEGNIKMARYIYDTQGLSAWSASFNCWKNI